MFKRLILSLVALVATAAWAAEIPKLTNPVNDYAKILTASEVAVLNTKIKNVALTYPNNPQVMVLTVSKLPAEGIDQFANDVYRAWGVGQKGKDNGVLLVLAPNDRKVRIEVGYGLEGVIPDAMSNQIIQDIKPDLKIKNWSKAVSTAVSEIIAALPKEKEREVTETPAPAAAPLVSSPPADLLKDLKDKAPTLKEAAPEKSGISAWVYFIVLAGLGVVYMLWRSIKKQITNYKYEPEPLSEVGKPRSKYSTNYAPPLVPQTQTYNSARPVSRGAAASARRNNASTNDSSFTDGLIVGSILGSASRRDDSDSYSSRSRSSDDSWSSSSSSSWSDSSSSSSSSSDSGSWSGGGGDSGGGGSSDSW